MARLRLRHLGYAFTVVAMYLTAACGGGNVATFPHLGTTGCGTNCPSGPIGAPAVGFATISPDAPTETQMDALLPVPGPALTAAPGMPQPPAPPDDTASNLRRRQALTFGALPVPFPHGAVQAVAISPKDGSLYAVRANSPAGYSPDGNIYQFANGAWTQVPGVASSIAVGSDGVVYAGVKSSGGHV